MKKLYCVLHFDEEDPECSSVEYLSNKKSKCISWVKENWKDYCCFDEEDEDPPKFTEDFMNEELNITIQELENFDLD